jgi:hypothetical protein
MKNINIIIIIIISAYITNIKYLKKLYKSHKGPREIWGTLNKTLYFTRHGQSTQNIFESTLISNYSKIKHSKHEAKVRSLCTTNSVEDKECIGIFKNYVESGNMWGMQAF